MFFRPAAHPLVLALTLILGLGGCNGGPGTSSSTSNTGGVSLQYMQISPVQPSIAQGTAIDLTVTGIYSDHSKEDLTTRATWKSSNTGVATISGTGGAGATAVSVAPGTTTVTATVGSVTASTTLSVTDAHLVGIDVSPPAPVVAAGTGIQLSATGRYSDGTRQDLTSQVTWQSSDQGVATVSTSGLLTGVAAGSATVTASFGKVQSSAGLTVTNASLSSIFVEPSSPSIAKGTTAQLSAIGVFSDGTTRDLTAVATWSSTSTAVAGVSNGGATAGLATALASGTATITAAYAGTSGTTGLTVTPAVLTAIGITPVTDTVPAGVRLQLTAVGTFSDGSTQDLTGEVTWTSTQESVATVGNAAGTYGLVNGLAAGNTAISATLDGVSGSLPLNVSNAVLVSINVSPTSPTIADGTSLALKATGNYSDGSTLDITDQVNWGSTDDAVAQVGNLAADAGVVQAKSAGSVVISAILNQKAGTTRLTVTSATLTGIQVTPADPSVAAGLKVDLHATGQYSDGSHQDLTDQVIWQSSDTSVVTVSNAGGSQGRAATLAAGSATVTATYGSVPGSTVVTVTDARLTSIQVTPSSPSMAKGTSVQLSAVGTYTDSSQQDLTSQVTWSSSDATVAAVSNAAGSSGTVTGTGGGQADITAALGSVQGKATVTVSVSPNTPVSLTAVASPNIILDNNGDTSTITVTVEPADPSGAVPDGTQVDFAVTHGTGLLNTRSATTTNGVATVTLTTGTPGTINVTATVHNTQVSNFASVYATSTLADAIGQITFSVAPVNSGMVPKGSVFSLFIYNLSNRSFNLDQYQMKDGATVLTTVTDAATLNGNGKLGPGQGTGILYTTSQDLSANGFQAVYSLTEPTTSTNFDVVKNY